MSDSYKSNDYKFEIEEFTEDDLSKDILDKQQLEKTKKKMEVLLKELKEANDKYNIDISLNEIMSLKESLGTSGDKVEHGIKNANILKYIILKTIKIDMEPLKDEIIDEVFVPSFISMPGVNTSYINYDATFFFKLYLTKDKLIYYCISDRFKITNKKIIDVKNIKTIGKAVKNRSWSRGLAWGVNTTSGYTSFIETYDKNTIYLNHLKYRYKESTVRFVSNVEKVTGIKAITKAKLTNEDKFVLIMEIIIALIFIMIGIPNLIKWCISM